MQKEKDERTPRAYPLKHVRLKQLYDAGFNVADFICFPPKTLDPATLKRFFGKHSKKHGVSIRNFHQDENRFFKCPVKYEVTDWNMALREAQQHNQTFYTLVNEAIPLQDAVYGGNIWLLDDRQFTVEYFKGPGSPRDTEGKNLEYFTRSIGQLLPEGTPQELVELGSCFRNFIPEERPIVIEFNIYPYPVGRRKSTVVIWEWRQGLLHETSEVIEALLGEIEALRAKNAMLEELIAKYIRPA